MNESLLTNLKSILNASKFRSLLDGAQIILPTGKEIFVQVQATEKVANVPSPYKFSFLTTLTDGTYSCTGYGSANFELLALEKSIAEALERVVYRNLKFSQYGTSNTNGWAAHASIEAAKRSALEELLERDAVLVHWLKRESMMELAPTSYPDWLALWLSGEGQNRFGFSSVRVLFSTLGYLPTTTIVMQDEFGHSVMSHATNSNLSQTISKALTETFRLAQIASTNRFVKSSRSLVEKNGSDPSIFSPEDHAMVYAHHLKFPSWIFGKEIDWRESEKSWRRRTKDFWQSPIEFKFHQMVSSPLVVGYCTSSEVQNLFFGPTLIAENEGLINFKRIFRADEREEINSLPHFVA